MFYTLKRTNLFGVEGAERSGRKMVKTETCAICKENKKTIKPFKTYKGFVNVCKECKPRAETTRTILRIAESRRSLV